MFNLKSLITRTILKFPILRISELTNRELCKIEMGSSKKHLNTLITFFYSSGNPAFNAQDFFQRIDRRLRATLKRKQIPIVSASHFKILIKVEDVDVDNYATQFFSSLTLVLSIGL